MLSDKERIYSTLARMREAMLKAHPEHLGGAVSDVLECALLLEDFQKEILSDLSQSRKDNAAMSELVTFEVGMKADRDRWKARHGKLMEAIHKQFDGSNGTWSDLYKALAADDEAGKK